jgi:hypothetical protein
MALNLIRLVRLFHIGVHHPDAFDAAHTNVWQALIIFAIVGLWLGWTRWSDAFAYTLTSNKIPCRKNGGDAPQREQVFPAADDNRGGTHS